MSQAYIGYDLQNALQEEELYNRDIYDIPVCNHDHSGPCRRRTILPLKLLPSQSAHFATEEQAKIAEEKYGYIMKEDSGRGYRRVVASPKPAEIVEIGAIRSPGRLRPAGNRLRRRRYPGYPSGQPLKGCQRCNR